jgi:phosphopantetheine--protein transferase-like protein
MIRVGIDLTPIERFAFIRRQGGNAFYQRVYTPLEQSTFGKDLLSLALCFAAKEAISKMLGTGLSLDQPNTVACRDIEISFSRGMHQPKAILTGNAHSVAWQLQIHEIALYLHHNHQVACAIVGGTDISTAISELRSSLMESLMILVPKLDRIAPEG